MLLKLRFASPNPARLLAWLSLITLEIGYGSVGWLLSAFSAPWLVWVGTFGITLHLATVKADAIALASGWVVAIISVSAVEKAWAPVWGGSHVPVEHAQLWAIVLLLLWLWAIVLIVLLGFAHKPLRSIGIHGSRSTHLLILLIWAALVLGKVAYHSQG